MTPDSAMSSVWSLRTSVRCTEYDGRRSEDRRCYRTIAIATSLVVGVGVD